MGQWNRWNSLVASIGIAIIAPIAIAEEKKATPEYVGTQACISCHDSEHSSWKSSKHSNKPPESVPDWSKTCAGCHTTNMSVASLTWGEGDVGCEACHGPGRDHASEGVKGKIVASKAADVCGQCHLGNDGQDGGKLMSDGTKWVVGYRPGMKLSNVPGLLLNPVDPAKIPPESGSRHRRNYNMWEASGHSKTLNLIINNSQASPECYGCHSDEGFKAKLSGKKIDAAQKESFSPVTCVTCHDPHNSKNPHQLVMDSEDLCSSCHTQRAVLQGKGARGIEETRSFHSAVDCTSCHMTEGNHLMKVIRPDDPDLSEKRLDTCTSCHKDNNRKARVAQLQEWQTSYKEGIEPLQADINAISAALKERPGLLDDKMKAKWNDLRANLSMLTKDGSRGAHNFDFAAVIMESAAKDLGEIKAAMK